VDTRVGLVLVVLNVLCETAVGLDGEDIAISRILVKRVSIDSIRGLTCGKDEDGAGIGVVVGGKG
jgi:hypothetical protein